MAKPFHRCATHGMVPLKYFKGVAVTAKGLMTGIGTLCKKMSPCYLDGSWQLSTKKSFRKILSVTTFS